MSAVIGNPLLLGPEGYQISRSVRLRSSASAYFNRTNASSPTNAIKWTWSGWVKRGSLGAQQNLVGATNSGSDDTYFNFNSSDQIVLGSYTGAGTDYGIKTAAVFRDPSAWYHIVAVLDTANATSADRAIIYVNGVRQTVTNSANGMWPQNATNNKINTASQVVNIGRRSLGDSYLDGYLTEINFIDGQALTPSSFGENDTVTGVWKPKKYAGTYGTNGFYLNFSDNSNNTAATIGKDYSGNGNNWTPNNISVTSGVTYDSMIDVPTPYADGGNGRGNYCVLNPLDFSSGTVSNGNTQWATTAAVGNGCFGSFAFDIADATNKYYWEMTITSGDGVFGIVPLTTLPSNTSRPGSYSYYTNGNKYSGTSASAYGSTFTSGDVIGVAVGNGSITFYKNNVSQGSAFTGLTGFFKPAIWEVSGTFQANFGQRPFTYTPPSGFKALNTQNLPAPTISNGALYMAASLYTGTASAQSINNSVNGVSFQPDFVWIKNRSNSGDHGLVDSVRGRAFSLYSNLTSQEFSSGSTQDLTSFNSNGFSVGTQLNFSCNASANTYVGWQWKAGGTGSSNTSGSITSTVSVNATAGFSVVTYTGNSTANATVGHGLGVAPNMVIIKARTSGSVENWPVYHSSLSAGQFLFLNTTNAVQAADGTFNSSTPVSSTVFQFGSPANTRTNSSSYAYVAYCFSAVAGYSAFGKYTGNGSSDGPFVFCGFRPRWIMIKRTDSTGSWLLIDTTRNPSNNAPNYLLADSSTTEGTDNVLDILSNGFKQRNAGASQNASGGTYIFAAFAENPFRYALAR